MTAGRAERRLAWLLLSPMLALVGLVAVVPLGWTVWESLHLHDLRMPWLGRPFVGLGNYAELFVAPRFRGALAHTLFFTVASVALELVLGLALALALNRAFRGRGLARAAALLPWAIPTVVAGLLWRFLFESDSGLVNAILTATGLVRDPPVWLVHPVLAWVPVLLADVWKSTPFVALLLLAGLQSIDPALYEAAAADGVAPAHPHYAASAAPGDRGGGRVPRAGCLPRVRSGLRHDRRRPGHGDGAARPLHVRSPAAAPQVRVRRGAVGGDVSRDRAHRGRVAAAAPRPRRDGGPVIRAGTGWGMRLPTVLLLAFAVLPFGWALAASLVPEAALFGGGVPWGRGLTLEHWRALFETRDFWLPIRNSLVVSSATTILCLVAGTLAALALARLEFRGRGLVLAGVLGVTMFPQISIVSPLYLLLRELRLIDTYPGLVLPYTTFALPLAVWLLTSFVRQLPRELEEAALVDGATRLQALVRVVLPLAAPGIATTAILTFIYCWNEFLFALSFTVSPERQTVPVAIALFRGQYQVPWGQILAAAVVATAPVALLVLAFQRRIVQGLTAGAVKG